MLFPHLPARPSWFWPHYTLPARRLAANGDSDGVEALSFVNRKVVEVLGPGDEGATATKEWANRASAKYESHNWQGFEEACINSAIS